MSTAAGWPGLDAPLAEADPEVYGYVTDELRRQQQTLEMIASENLAPLAVMQAQGRVLTNKYAEGYPGRRYYGGCEFVDEIERLAIERIKELFGAGFANVQPHSGAQANAAAMQALIKPGDTHPRPVAGPRRSPDARHADQLLRAALRRHRVRGVEGGPPGRHGPGEPAGPRVLPEADHRRLVGLPAAARLRPVPGRSPTRSVPTCWSTWPTSPAWSPPGCTPPGAARACHHLDHPQDAGRPARRRHPDQRRGAGQEDQLRGVPRPAGRPARARHRRQGRRVQDGR